LKAIDNEPRYEEHGHRRSGTAAREQLVADQQQGQKNENKLVRVEQQVPSSLPRRSIVHLKPMISPSQLPVERRNRIR
jgi:hypothetical protein